MPKDRTGQHDGSLFIENAIGFFILSKVSPISVLRLFFRNRLIWLEGLLKVKGNGEERSLLHVAIVAKFLDLNKLFPASIAENIEKIDMYDFPVV